MKPWPRYGLDAVAGKAVSAARAFADLIWPPVSPLSGEDVPEPGALSPQDWSRVTFIDAPVCAKCGLPLPYPVGEGAWCAPCHARPPAYDAARAAFVYDEDSRALVLQLKHAGRTDTLKAFGRWMRRAGGPLVETADAIVPVPLHPSRLRKRRFNQSFLLARTLSEASGVRLEPHALARTRRTSTQGGKSARGRARNVAGAFKVRADAKDRLKEARLILVDDVHTTGATLEACARALKRAGARDVTAITLARVVKPVDPLK